ncbi:DUF3137 domain-containing protein [Roseobacter sp. EG26]|uniref:DUF3137 domain-containing protein n=1 Tax=Roseobacter sp. EG26 TaxID=3412477 RepID=UPI003CE53821
MSQFIFSEREGYEEGFSEIYDRELVPILREMETARRKGIHRSRVWIAILAIVSAYLAWQGFKLHPVLPLFPVLAGAGGVLFVCLSRHDKLHDELNSIVRPVVCRFFEGTTYTEAPLKDAFPVDHLRSLNLIPVCDHNYVGPSVEGNWRNTDYRMTKASFYNERRDSDGDRRSTRLFSGVILEIECYADMPTIVFLPDFGPTLNKVFAWATQTNRPDQKLHFPIDAVEEVFEVYTDDLQRAQELITPEFGLKLLEFSREYQTSSQHIAAAFKGKKFYLAIRLNHDFMNFDVFGAPLCEANGKIHEALADMVIPRKVIDDLLD